MTTPDEEFTSTPSSQITEGNPLIVGITAPSFGGKTYSALELATGMAKVTGWKIALVDTEAGRGRHYKDLFAYEYVPFKPPFSPMRYMKAIDYCLKHDFKIIIIDQMTYEHSGDGGVLDQIEDYLQAKAGDDFRKRESYKWAAQIAPKAQRKALNQYIEQVGTDAMFILCYLANDITKPVKDPLTKKTEAVHVGWTAETTSKLPTKMTIRFLLPPASDGKPNLNPDTEFEKLSIKMPEMFRGWFKPGLQLNRALGEKLARWSLGSKVPEATTVELAWPEQVTEMRAEMKRLGWDKARALAWLATWNVTQVASIPREHAADALGQLIKMEVES